MPFIGKAMSCSQLEGCPPHCFFVQCRLLFGLFVAAPITGHLPRRVAIKLQKNESYSSFRQTWGGFRPFDGIPCTGRAPRTR